MQSEKLSESTGEARVCIQYIPPQGFPIFELWLACWTQAEIAAEVGTPQKTIDDVLAKVEPFPDFGKRFHARFLVAELPDSLKPAALHADLDPPLYNVWKRQGTPL